MVFSNFLFFSMLVALGGENTLFLPFNFMNLAALGAFAMGGHNADKQFERSEAGKESHQPS
jgi:hypothetical protein